MSHAPPDRHHHDVAAAIVALPAKG